MRDGRAVETDDAGALFAAPKRAYTRALLDAVPRIDVMPRNDGGGEVAARTAAPTETVLSAMGVVKTFDAHRGRAGVTRALDDVSLTVGRGEVVALVGESGSGKSTLGRAVARLVDIDRGEVEVGGENLTQLSGRALRRARANIQMVFQDPYASLDPRFTIGRTVAEPIIIHRRGARAAAVERAMALLARVGLDAGMAGRYPHEFSGGQRQRVAIARALAAEPRVIIADEPTSALDVSIQEQILDLLAELRDERGIGMLFISHDLAVVRRISSRVVVMRAGRILESGPTDIVLAAPAHAYTRALLSAVPLPDPARRGRSRIAVPRGDGPVGPLAEIAPGHWVAS
jgi:ABC-type glutathione transport system ATPase component